MKITYNSTNYYLIPCDNGFLLIDAGWSGKVKLFKKKLSELGIELAQIKYILLTHHHHDHAAIVQKLKELTNAKLIVHKSQIPYITAGITNYHDLTQYNFLLLLIDRLTRPFISYSYPPILINSHDIIIENHIDNIALRKIGIKGKIISTPGHSRDSISVILDDGTAYVGDLAMNIDSMKLIAKLPLPIEAEDLAQVKVSLNLLINHGCLELHPSHGAPFSKSKIENILQSH